MKILAIFSKHFWPENFKINNVCFKLKKKFKIFVFTSEPGYNNIVYKNSYKKNSVLNGIQVNYFKTYKRKNNLFLSILLDYFSYIFVILFKLKYLNKFKPNSVLTFATSPLLQAIPAIIYAKIKKTPSILWVQDLWPEVLEDTGYIKNQFILSVINLLVKKIYSSSDLILAQSDSFKKHIIKKYNLKNKTRVLHQPSEIKFQKFKKNLKKNVIFTFAGNLGQAQDFETILNAFLSKQLNKNILLYIIGSGNKFEFIKNFIKKNNLKSRIILKKYVPPKKLHNYLKQSDSFIVTLKNGKSLNKTIPGKFQTYVAYGKPILVSSNGSLCRFVEQNNIGFSNKPREVNKIVKNMNYISKLGMKQKIKIYFSLKKVYQDYFDLNKVVNDLSGYIKLVESKYVKKNIL